MESAEKMLLEMEDRGVKQDFIPSEGQLEFASVSMKGWIFEPHVHGLLDGPGDVALLPTHCGKIFESDAMPQGHRWGKGP